MKNIMLFIGLSFLARITLAQSPNDVLNLLIANKTISEAQADSLRAEATIKQRLAEANKKNFWINAGRQMQMNGYIQFRYQNLDEASKIDGFDIRRARLDL